MNNVVAWKLSQRIAALTTWSLYYIVEGRAVAPVGDTTAPDTAGNDDDDDDDHSMVTLSHLLLALATCVLYYFFLRPTAATAEEGTAAAATTTTTTTTPAGQQQQRERMTSPRSAATRRRMGGAPQPPVRPFGGTTVAATPTVPRLSDNAYEILQAWMSSPPHLSTPAQTVAVTPGGRTSTTNRIGGFPFLAENGLIAFAHTQAAAATATTKATVIVPTVTTTGESAVTDTVAATAPPPPTVTTTTIDAAKVQRQERARILSRLFKQQTQTTTNTTKTNTTTTTTTLLPAMTVPPSKGSTFVIGISQRRHLHQAEQLDAIRRVIQGLASAYNILLIVAMDADENDTTTENTGTKQETATNEYERMQTLHARIVQTVRKTATSTPNTPPSTPAANEEDSRRSPPECNSSSRRSSITETVLPSHRILLSQASTAGITGRVALVRQLASNIGVAIDFEDDVQPQLARFGYRTVIIPNWSTVFAGGGSGSATTTTTMGKAKKTGIGGQ